MSDLRIPQLKIIARIAAERVRSLVWQGGGLVDWVTGGTRYELDGNVVPRLVNYAYRFDSACTSPSGRYAVIYEKLGTKGLLLRDGKILRELNRSFYCANVYEYPVCFAELADGREVLIHCPDEYCQLDIEDVQSGERLTKVTDRKPADIFHSRLTVDPQQAILMSAGWIWHPFDVVTFCSIQEALKNPKSLDRSLPDLGAEASTAAFLPNNQVLIATNDETMSDGDYEPNQLRPNSLSVFDVEQNEIQSVAPTSQLAGTLLPLDDTYCVAFYQHPKLINFRTGEFVDSLAEFNSGEQDSSIIHHKAFPPPLALDQANRRFALASSTEIIVVEC